MATVLHTLLRRWKLVASVLLLVLLTGEAAILTVKWPFTRERAIQSHERATSTRVQFSRFRQTFLPYPGYIADGVSFQRDGAPSLATMQRITVQGSWTAMLTFTRRLKLMRMEGLHVRLPAKMPAPVRHEARAGAETVIGELVVDGAVLEVARQPEDSPLRFDITKLTLHEAAKSRSTGFETVLRNPEPPGNIKASGAFGPVLPGQTGLTPVSGQFTLMDADLSRYQGIAGTLSANGSFQGPLQRIAVQGRASLPNFEVTRSSHSVSLQTEYRAVVNGLTGDTRLEDVSAQFLRTTLAVRGDVAGQTGQSGKTASFAFQSREAQIGDLLGLFVKTDQPPLNGPLTFQASVVLPPGKGKFLQKVCLDADFGITDSQFTALRTQGKLNELSARARGEKKKEGELPDRVVSDLKGHVVLRNAVATFSNLSFGLPGATARGGGTYNLLTQQINLRGMLTMEATLSEASSGIKSVLLKPFNVFFKKKHAGAVVPVSITGTYSHPTFRVLLTGKK